MKYYYIWYRAWPENGSNFKGECVVACITERYLVDVIYATIEKDCKVKLKDVHVRRLRKL